MWGGTRYKEIRKLINRISIHPPRVGWDMYHTMGTELSCTFQSTHPVWGGTAIGTGVVTILVFQSTHPVWGGTARAPVFRRLHGNFNPPTPCGVGHSDRRRTSYQLHFNPPTPCGVGPHSAQAPRRPGDFNPPTPCGVGQIGNLAGGDIVEFQSTHPVWGGTVLHYLDDAVFRISIHPPRVGWDCHLLFGVLLCLNFNPPTPCGVGRLQRTLRSVPQVFQSTHPVWGGTTPFATVCWK